LAGTVLLAPCLLMFILFTVIPAGRTAWLSLCDAGAMHSRWVGLQNYFDILTNPLFWKVLGQTMLYIVVGTPLVVLIPAAIALAANTGSERYGTVIRFAYYLPFVTSGAAMGAIWRWLFDADVGGINNALAWIGIEPIAWLGTSPWAFIAICIVLVLGGQGVPVCIYMAALSVVGKSTLEAARIDGCTQAQEARYILWPAILPVVATLGLMTATGTFQVWQLIKIMTGGGPMESTLSIVYWMYETGFGANRMGYAAAIGMLMVLPIGIPLLIKQRALWGDRR